VAVVVHVDCRAGKGRGKPRVEFFDGRFHVFSSSAKRPM
jgi:hypothetical protein